MVNSQESVKLGTHSQRLRDGNRKTTTTSDKHAALNTNGVSKRREVGDGQMANKLRGKQRDIETEFWWLSLPYVLVRKPNFIVYHTSLNSVNIGRGCAMIRDVISFLFVVYF